MTVEWPVVRCYHCSSLNSAVKSKNVEKQSEKAICGLNIELLDERPRPRADKHTCGVSTSWLRAATSQDRPELARRCEEPVEIERMKGG